MSKSGQMLNLGTRGSCMEVNVKEARSKISALLDRAQQGEQITITRRGQRIARLVPIAGSQAGLPDLSAFRESIAIQGKPLSRTVIETREEERY